MEWAGARQTQTAKQNEITQSNELAVAADPTVLQVENYDGRRVFNGWRSGIIFTLAQRQERNIFSP